MKHLRSFLKSPRGKVILLVFVLAVGLFAFFHRGTKRKEALPPSLPLVKVLTVEKQDMMRHITLSGQTVAKASIVLAPKYTGRVQEVLADLGDFVRRGDALLVQETEDLSISIRKSQAEERAGKADELLAEATYNANYVKAKNDLEISEDKWKRKQYLFSIGALSQNALDSAKQEYLTSRAAFEILENQALNDEDAASVLSKRYAAEKIRHSTAALEKEREDMTLRAPASGIISYRNVEMGQIVSAGTKVFTLVDVSSFYVDAPLSESDAALLEPGDVIPVTVDALGKTFEGKIIYVSPAMDDNSKTYTVRLLLDNIDKVDIKAGLFAHGDLSILQKKNTIFVPKEAVFRKNGKAAIFVMREDSTVEERLVTIGLLNDSEEEILSGLRAGETVVLNNQDKLQTGTKVEAKEKE